MRLTSYAQFLEDVVLYRALSHVSKGFYIDVGANQPVRDSVTKLFYERGWRGINIEPSPRWFPEIENDRPRDINLRLVISSSAGEAVFHEIVDTGLSTMIEDFAKRHEAAGFNRLTYTMQTRTLASVCAEYVDADIHFLKVDVEGAELAVFEGCDFGKWRPWIIVAEATEPNTTVPNHANWEHILLQNGYSYATTDGINRFYLASEHSELAALLLFPADDYERAIDVTRRETLQEEKAIFQREYENVRQQLLAFHEERASFPNECEILRLQLLALQHQIGEFRRSHSWRFTAPLRAVSSLLAAGTSGLNRREQWR